MAINHGPQDTQRNGSQASGRAHRGFAAMDRELQRQIARKGGMASATSQSRDSRGQFKGGGASNGDARAGRQS